VVNATFPRGGTLSWEGDLTTDPFDAYGTCASRVCRSARCGSTSRTT
jgi:hypothetical protein